MTTIGERYLPPSPPLTEERVPVATSSQAPRFSEVLSGLGREVDRGEALVEGAIGARHSRLGTADLIALQAGIYRYTEVVDLTSKLVDRASNAVRTTLSGQG